jgi:hypothetical protein
MNLNKSFLGRDELSTGKYFSSVTNPTLYDVALRNMIDYIKISYGIGDRLKLLGVYLGETGSDVADFLKNYIATASGWRQSYNYNDRQKWFDYFKANFQYSDFEINEWLKTLRTLNQSGRIPKAIFEPWTYTDNDPTDSVDFGLNPFKNLSLPRLNWTLIAISSVGIFFAYKYVKGKF